MPPRIREGQSVRRERNILMLIDAEGGIFGSIDASSNLHKTVYPSVGQSVGPSIRPSHFREY